MFELLSDKKQVLAIIAECNGEEIELLRENFAKLTQLFSASSRRLLENKKQYGVLFPQVEHFCAHLISENERAEVNLCKVNKALFLDKNNLVHAINQLSLTQASFVHFNLVDCLDSFEAQCQQTESQANLTKVRQQLAQANLQANEHLETQIKKSNVAPIRINVIKQRLAKAMTAQNNKAEQVKSRLNSLLTEKVTETLGDTKTNKLANASIKQA